ncbi:RibD family protein [bacterium]|nr:MAG: RibD family protein [bacterium]
MTAPYAHIVFEPAPADRPTVYINMVSTIDGKIVSGTRDEPVMDLGTDIDHEAMRRLDAVSDAVLVGAQTLRATPKTWRPRGRISLVATQSGNLPSEARYFEGESYVIAPRDGDYPAPWLGDFGSEIDWARALKKLREMGVEKLYVLGGSEINAELLSRDLVDELFLTVAPKIKLGADTPTFAGGTALPREALLKFELVESHIIGDEVFLRYRRERKE